MKTLVKENDWLTRRFIDLGWGNGYVLIPEGHPLHGKHCRDIDVDVHGGLTFSELVDDGMIERWGMDAEDKGKRCVGFDTNRSYDSLSEWPKKAVMAETDRLAEQLLSYKVVSKTDR